MLATLGIWLTHIRCWPQWCTMGICWIYVWCMPQWEVGWHIFDASHNYAQWESAWYIYLRLEHTVGMPGTLSKAESHLTCRLWQISPRIVLLFDHDTPPVVCHHDTFSNVMSEWFLRIRCCRCGSPGKMQTTTVIEKGNFLNKSIYEINEDISRKNS